MLPSGNGHFSTSGITRRYGRTVTGHAHAPAVTTDVVPAAEPLDVGALRLLQAVGEHGTLTAAAVALGISQPAASQHVRRLERRLGTALLDRSGRRVRLTEAGRVLARHGVTVSAALHAAHAEVAALTGLRAGVVRLVGFPSAAATLVPPALAQLRAAHPGLTVALQEAEPPASLDLLRAGAADVVLGFTYDGAGAADLAGLHVEPLLVDTTHVALPADHPAAAPTGPQATGLDLADLDLADLADADWIAGCPRCRGHLVDASRARGFEPRVVHATDDYPAVLGLVAAGLGVAVLPGLVAPAARRTDGVVLRRAAGTRDRRVWAATTPDLARVPSVAATTDALHRAAAALGTV